jgi:alpha-mannosidase
MGKSPTKSRSSYPTAEGEYLLKPIDYSLTDRGVTLLNRGLPGNNVADGNLMLSLLKCTALKEGYGEFKLEDATRQGYEIGKTHTFDYALLLHGGDWRQAKSYRHGAEFNHPLIAWKPRRPGMQTTAHLLPKRISFIQVQGKSTVLSAVRSCPGGMIVRVYEAEGRREEAAFLELAWPAQAVHELNLIEKEETILPISSTSDRLPFSLHPFEIKTFKITF